MAAVRTYRMVEKYRNFIRRIIPDKIKDDARVPFVALLAALVFGLAVSLTCTFFFIYEGLVGISLVNVGLMMYFALALHLLYRIPSSRISVLTEITCATVILVEVFHTFVFGLEAQFQTYIMLAAALVVVGTTSPFLFRVFAALTGVAVMVFVTEVFAQAEPDIVLSPQILRFLQSFNYSLVNVSFFVIFIAFFTWIDMNLRETKLRNIEAIRLAEMRARMLATMAHELRTPLNGMTGMTEIMLRNPDADVSRSDLRTIHDASRSMASIIDELLEFSKIDSGRTTLSNVTYTLFDVLRDTLNLTTTKHRTKRLDVVVDIDPTTPAQWVGDPLKVRQILINLVDNAMKYTFEGTVTLKVHAVSESSRDILTFVVIDTGIGIRKDIQSQIFDIYARMDMKHKQIDGLGLGLAITKRYVDAMGGTLTMESVYGKGSTFIVSLPGRTVGDDVIGHVVHSHRNGLVRNHAHMPEDREIVHTEPLKDMTVLIVEDNQLGLRVVESFVKTLGATAKAVTTVHEALVILSQGDAIDMVITDFNLADMQAERYLESIRTAMASGPDIPVIVMTGDSALHDHPFPNGLEPDAVMTKPLSLERMRRTVMAVMEKTHDG
jgi:signal transduction histidine kinase